MFSNSMFREIDIQCSCRRAVVMLDGILLLRNGQLSLPGNVLSTSWRYVFSLWQVRVHYMVLPVVRCFLSHNTIYMETHSYSYTSFVFLEILSGYLETNERSVLHKDMLLSWCLGLMLSLCKQCFHCPHTDRYLFNTKRSVLPILQQKWCPW